MVMKTLEATSSRIVVSAVIAAPPPRRGGRCRRGRADRAATRSCGEAEPVIEVACRVPVQHPEIEASALALDGDLGQPLQQRLPETLAARALAHEQVLEIDPGPSLPGRVVVEV